MKATMCACVTLAVLLTAPAHAQQGNPGAQMLDQWDLDGDGQVTLDEAMIKRGDVFYMFDLDSDGSLSAEDWAGVAQHMADEMGTKGAGMGQRHGNGPGAVMHEAMTVAFNDADGDGLVTAAEFNAATQKLFPLLDSNADGVVTAADFGR